MRNRTMSGLTNRRLLVSTLILSAWLGPAVVAAREALTQISEQTIVLAPGARALVELAETPSTGYVWRLDPQRSQNAAIVKIDDQGYTRPPDAAPPIGAAGRHRWALEGLMAGRARLTFVNVRSWENQPVREHVVAIEVR